MLILSWVLLALSTLGLSPANQVASEAQARAEQAASHLELAAKLEPGNSRIFYSLSRAYRRLERTEDALKTLKTYENLKAQEEISTRTATE